MGIRKIGKLKRKPIVEGDLNLVKQNEVTHIQDIGGGGLNPEHDYILWYAGTSSETFYFGFIDLQTGKSSYAGYYPEDTYSIDESPLTYTITKDEGSEDVEHITVTCISKIHDPGMNVSYLPGKYYSSKLSAESHKMLGWVQLYQNGTTEFIRVKI